MSSQHLIKSSSSSVKRKCQTMEHVLYMDRTSLAKLQVRPKYQFYNLDLDREWANHCKWLPIQDLIISLVNCISETLYFKY